MLVKNAKFSFIYLFIVQNYRLIQYLIHIFSTNYENDHNNNLIFRRTEYGANLDGSFELTQASGSFNLELIMHFMENMYIDYVGKYINPHYSSQSTVVLFYRNPKKLFHHLSLGGDLKIDRLWEYVLKIIFVNPNSFAIPQIHF